MILTVTFLKNALACLKIIYLTNQKTSKNKLVAENKMKMCTNL